MTLLKEMEYYYISNDVIIWGEITQMICIDRPTSLSFHPCRIKQNCNIFNKLSLRYFAAAKSDVTCGQLASGNNCRFQLLYPGFHCFFLMFRFDHAVSSWLKSYWPKLCLEFFHVVLSLYYNAFATQLTIFILISFTMYFNVKSKSIECHWKWKYIFMVNHFIFKQLTIILFHYWYIEKIPLAWKNSKYYIIEMFFRGHTIFLITW